MDVTENFVMNVVDAHIVRRVMKGCVRIVVVIVGCLGKRKRRKRKRRKRKRRRWKRRRRRRKRREV